MSVKIMRSGQEINFVVPVVTKHEKNMYGRMDDLRFIGLDTLPNVIGGFAQGSPAQEAGLEVGDTIIEIDSKPIAGWMDIQKAVESAQNDTIQVKILRDGQVISKDITPKTIGEGGQARRLIGIGPEQDLKALGDPDFAKVKHRFGLIEALKRGTKDFLEISGMTYNAIYSMLTGTMSAKDNIGGPVLIYNIVVDAKEEGFSYFLFILGVISLNLAIFNLLPIIPLDGGHLFMMAIEKIKGSPLPAKVENIIGNVGFSLIILLALYVFYIDFARIGLIDSIKNLPSKISQSVSQ